VERIRERRAAAAQEARSRVERLAAEREELDRVVSARDAIHRAMRRLGLARKVGDERARRVARIAALRETVRDTQARRRRVEDAVAAAEREAGQATLRAADLRRRFQLTSEVPCVGTDFQGRCKLLGDANAAKPLIPSADSEIVRIAECKASLSTELTEYRLAIEHAEGELSKLQDEQRKAKLTQVRRTYLESLVAAADELARAERRASAVAIELADASRAATEAANSDEGGEEIRRCNASVLETQSRVAQVSSDRDRETARIRRELAELPPGADKSAVANREVSCSRASERVREADVQYVEAIRAQENARQIAAALSSIRARQAKSVARRQRLENEVSCWAMLQKACSNDGIIALAIDDAGPTLAELTNTLLRACHGQRFSVAIRTEVQTAKGETREGFDIVVHDADSGSMKSVAMMSGGQKTIVDLCLTRAIALYLARNSGRRYDALFSDEADGPLDIDNKRMFMAMKREVLRLGGYDVEYFITQTPELVAMADHVIDVAAMRSRPRVDA
jgi:exonuclease SbcC